MAGKRLDWSARAIGDRERIADYYILEASPVVALEASRAIRDAAARILEAPLSYRLGRQGTREYVMRKFPFTLIFRIEPDAIRIIRVMHQARQYFNR